MRLRLLARGLLAGTGALSVAAVAGAASADPTNLQQTNPILWTLIIISAAGAALTFGVLAYALIKFRDPRTKGRRYG